jgi:hypothetical protein
MIAATVEKELFAYVENRAGDAERRARGMRALLEGVEAAGRQSELAFGEALELLTRVKKAPEPSGPEPSGPGGPDKGELQAKEKSEAPKAKRKPRGGEEGAGVPAM